MWNRHVILAALTELGEKGRLGRPCRPDEVLDLERRLDVRLPDAYRDFVLRVGDGGPGHGLWPLRRSVRWADRGVYAPRYLATPFPFTSRVPAEYFEDLDEEDHYDEVLTGSMILAELGHGTYFRLVVTGSASGQVWRDEVRGERGLIPGLDFGDWYVNWLRRLGVLKGMPAGRRRLV